MGKISNPRIVFIFGRREYGLGQLISDPSLTWSYRKGKEGVGVAGV
jgi:hypothetical protein